MSKFIPYKSFYNTHLMGVPEKKEYSPTLGSNQKNISIVLAHDGDPINYIFLEKIVSAVNLDLDKDIIRFEIPNQEAFSFIKWHQLHTPQYFISFGKEVQDLGLNIQAEKYKPFHLKSCTFLMADRLDEIESNKELKGSLWKSLQALFL